MAVSQLLSSTSGWDGLRRTMILLLLQFSVLLMFPPVIKQLNLALFVCAAFFSSINLESVRASILVVSMDSADVCIEIPVAKTESPVIETTETIPTDPLVRESPSGGDFTYSTTEQGIIVTSVAISGSKDRIFILLSTSVLNVLMHDQTHYSDPPASLSLIHISEPTRPY